MNIYSIAEESQALEEVGIAIDTPERLRLELGLLRLSELANADQLLFWGKVSTTSAPYYIAVGVDFKGHYSFPHKKFYYARDNFVFSELPAPDPSNRPNANQFNHAPFTGNPQTVLLALPEEEKKEAKKEEEDSESEEVDKVEPKNYTEEDRLSYTVQAIEEECQLVPRGAVRMVTAHELRYNEQFKGVGSKQFGLGEFQHFRYPHAAAQKQAIESVQAVFSYDILDPVSQQTGWSAQRNLTQSLGTVRSLSWPGYVAYAFFGRNTFGGVYFGNGIKQTELDFYV